MCWVKTKGRAAKMHTSSQLDTVSRYMSRGRRWTSSGRPGRTRPRPAVKVMMLDQMKACRSPVRSKWISVPIGTSMLMARVMRKMPIMYPRVRRVGRAI
ncbi:hypothetical protein D3C80_1625120 [compost metagenome]